jgi:hypothetical protein
MRAADFKNFCTYIFFAGPVFSVPSREGKDRYRLGVPRSQRRATRGSIPPLPGPWPSFRGRRSSRHCPGAGRTSGRTRRIAGRRCELGMPFQLWPSPVRASNTAGQFLVRHRASFSVSVTRTSHEQIPRIFPTSNGNIHASFGHVSTRTCTKSPMMIRISKVQKDAAGSWGKRESFLSLSYRKVAVAGVPCGSPSDTQTFGSDCD